MLGFSVRALLGFIGKFCRWMIFLADRMPASVVMGMGTGMEFGGLDLVVGGDWGCSGWRVVQVTYPVRCNWNLRWSDESFEL